MDLLSALLDINRFSEQETIYAEQPWTLESLAKVIPEPDNGMTQISDNGTVYHYFLKVLVAKELLEDLETHSLCMRDSCQRIIEYAIDDA